MMYLLIVALCAPGGELWQADFSSPPPQLSQHTLGAGVATLSDGVLVLDLTSPTTGKAAWAELELDLPLPCRITWDQRVAVDSPHAYYAGLELRGQYGAPVTVAAGGAGAGHRVNFPELPPVTQKVGEWLHYELRLHTNRRALAVSDQDGVVAQSSVRASTPSGPLRLRFWINEVPEKLPDGDAYAQNRGRAEFDNVRIERIQPAPVVPGQPYDTRQPIVFNRALQWQTTSAGPLAYDTADLPLTGTDPVSDWIAAPALELRPEGTTTRFSRPHAKAIGPDRAVIRQLQFHLGQHPKLQYHLTPQNARTRLLVTLTCPYRLNQLVVYELPWTDQATSGEIDLNAALAKWGEHRVYAELDVVLDLDAPEGVTEGHGELAAALALPLVPTVVAPTHLVWDSRLDHGSIAAKVVGAEAPSVIATHTDPPTPLTLRNGLWQADLKLPAGIHDGAVLAKLADGRELRQAVEARVSDRKFVTAHRGAATYSLDDGTRLPPLLGDLFAWVPWDDPTTPHRRMLTGPETASAERTPPLTKWRSMNPTELRERVAYLAGTGLRIARLTPNTTPQESILDAGGHVCPHGLEQLQRVLTELDRHHARALLNLFHYQYGSASTGHFPPFTAYLEAGYRGPQDWTQPAIVKLQQGYLAELLSAIGGDPAVLGYTPFGENDNLPGADWHNALSAFLKQRAPHHLVVFEQGGALQHHGQLKPDAWQPFAGALDGGVGYRTYSGAGVEVDAYDNLCARWYAQDQPAYLAEVCSCGPGWYSSGNTWLRPDFITKFRDNLWASLTAPQAMSLYWSVCLIEGERTLPTEIAESLDWSGFQRAKGVVAVVVPYVDKTLLPKLGQLDALCCRAGVTYDFVAPGSDLTGYRQVMEISPESPEPALSPEALAARLVSPSEGNAATVLADQAGRFLLVYLRNVVEHREGPSYGKRVTEPHRQRAAERVVKLSIQAMPDGVTVKVWDIDLRQEVFRGKLPASRELDLGTTNHDFAVLLQR